MLIMNVCFLVLNSFEGTFSLKVPLSVREVSYKTFFIRKLPFMIIAEYYEDIEAQYLQLSIKCCDANKPYVHEVQYTLNMVSSNGTKCEISEKSTRTFSSKMNGLGFVQQFDMINVADKDRDLITDGEIKVNVDAEFIE